MTCAGLLYGPRFGTVFALPFPFPETRAILRHTLCMTFRQTMKGYTMVISIRVSPEQEQKYRDFAAAQGLTVSEFVRRSADAAIARAEEILRQADEERRHREEVEDWKRRFAEYKQRIEALNLGQITDEEIEAMRLEQYA